VAQLGEDGPEGLVSRRVEVHLPLTVGCAHMQGPGLVGVVFEHGELFDLGGGKEPRERFGDDELIVAFDHCQDARKLDRHFAEQGLELDDGRAHDPRLGLQLARRFLIAGAAVMVVVRRVQALIECEIRLAMTSAKLKELPLYPEERGCYAPGAPRIFEIFSGLARQHLIGPDGAVIQTFSPELTKLQQTVLDLHGVSEQRYR
jgi:hypothetical protein